MPAKYDPDTHHRRSIRLQDYDYARAGAYFVTICVYQKECLLGAVVDDGVMELNAAGKMVQSAWYALPERFPSIVLDEFVVMPNHVHGIVIIVGAQFIAPDFPGRAPMKSGRHGDRMGVMRGKGAASGTPTVGEILRAFKSISGVRANRLLSRSGQPFWQRNYYKRIIRSEAEGHAIREYIVNNPRQWAMDEENPKTGQREGRSKQRPYIG